MKKEKKLFSLDSHMDGYITKDTDECPKLDKKEMLSRRSFLKKSAYSAPVIIALGQLTKPSNARADTSVPAPPPLW